VIVGFGGVMRGYTLAIRSHLKTLALAFSMFTFKTWGITSLTAAIGLFVIGLPTAIYENPFFVRMTPVRAQDYVIWIMSTSGDGKVVSGGVLSVLAVGCPTCNKLVVLLLGTTGALTFFAPLQLYIGIGSVLLLGWTLLLRAKALTDTCSVSQVTAQQT